MIMRIFTNKEITIAEITPAMASVLKNTEKGDWGRKNLLQ